jgi:hypothetical protein
MAEQLNRLRAIVLLAGAIVLLSGCGSGPNQINEAPPIPPTATPAPRPGLDGPLLTPLQDGAEVTAPDHRYTVDLPAEWTETNPRESDFVFSGPGGMTYEITRAPLPDDVSTARAWSEAEQEAADDVETVSFEPVQVSGSQAVRWVYRESIDGEEFLLHVVFVVDGDTGFRLTGSAPAGDEDATISLFDSISGSFTLPRG